MIHNFILSYGYFAVFLGTLLEGETILIAAGFAAHLGILDLSLVILVAMAGATLGDQMAFLLGRWKGASLLARFPSLERHKHKVDDLLSRYDAAFILGVRFLYGLRIAGPLIMGASRVLVLRFALFNLIGAALWAILIAGLGYIFGLALKSMLIDIKKIEEIVFIAILLLGLLYWLLQRVDRSKQDNNRGSS